jgi:Lhr-like helicase
MVLRNPLGRKRKVGGKDWTERRLFEQIRVHAPDFILLKQADREASLALCDLAEALAFVERLTSVPIRLRQLAQASPFGDSMLRGHGPAGAIASPVNYRTDEPTEPI